MKLNKLNDIIERATDFGTKRSHENIFSFTLKCLFFIIPAVMLGNYTDVTIKRVKNEKTLGNNLMSYILLQTLIIVSTFYLILLVSSGYASEFQLTIEGVFFMVLYFGMQSNYILMIKRIFVK
jgi:hypothetical protein